MKSTAQSIKLFLSCLTFLFVLIPNKLFAVDVLDLSWTLTEGGYRLELDSASPHKGVKLEITSNIATQYEVTASIIKPLENKDNPEKLISDNFVLRGLIGTNKFGNLRVPTNDSPLRTNDILYVSNTAGSPDSFTLVYGIINKEEIAPGNYFGRLGFTLRPVGSARQTVTKILDVYITIAQGESEKAKIEIAPLNSLRTISLNSQKENLQSADVSIKINGAFNDLFNIKQIVTAPLESNEGSQLDYSALNFIVKEVNKGQSLDQRTPLLAQAQAIYTSKPNGEYDNDFIITYRLSDIAKTKAGKYRSRIQYLLDETGKIPLLLETLDLEVELERIFDFILTPQDNLPGISFANLKPKEPPRKNEVIIEVLSNINKQYQISQNVHSDLTNKEGSVIAAKYFTLKTESIDTKGTLKFPVPQEVKKGDTILFISDSAGAPDKFKLIYELTCPLDIIAGDYSTRIIYSLLEI